MLKVAMGPWPADKRQRLYGTYSLLAAETGFEAVGMALLVRGGMSVEEARAVVGAAERGCRDGRVHAYSKQ